MGRIRQGGHQYNVAANIIPIIEKGTKKRSRTLCMAPKQQKQTSVNILKSLSEPYITG